jgi:GMP synthase PP-ATPase subunit
MWSHPVKHDRTGQYDDIWQAFAVLLPVKTVGVMATSAQ